MANVRLLSLAVYAVLAFNGKAQNEQDPGLVGGGGPPFGPDPGLSAPKGREFFGVKSDICTEEERARCPEYRQLEYLLAKGCKPVYRRRKCCAVRFRCVRNFQKKLEGRCYAFGRFYKKNAPVPPPMSDPCFSYCVCGENSRINCGIAGCFGQTLDPGCYETYRLNECCPTGLNCRNSTTPVCKYGGDEAYEGQFLNFSDIRLPDSCQQCICSSSYSGPFGPGCQRKRCGYSNHKGSPLYSGCIPVFAGSSCCIERTTSGSNFLCPTSDLIISNQGCGQGDKETCRFGNIFIRKGDRLQLTDPNIRCECLTPPELHCSRASL